MASLFGDLIYRVCPDGAELLKWEQDLLGLELVESQFPGGGVGLATSSTTQIKKGALIAQYIGRFLVLTKDETDLLFHPMFFENHERLIELGPIMQPIVYEKHASALHYRDVSSVLVCAHIIFYENKPVVFFPSLYVGCSRTVVSFSYFFKMFCGKLCQLHTWVQDCLRQ